MKSSDMLGETFIGRAYLPKTSYDTVAHSAFGVLNRSPALLASGTIL